MDNLHIQQENCAEKFVKRIAFFFFAVGVVFRVYNKRGNTRDTTPLLTGCGGRRFGIVFESVRKITCKNESSRIYMRVQGAIVRGS